MALTDTFEKNAKHTGATAGDKHAHGGGMFLLVNAAGKHCRMDYRFAERPDWQCFRCLRCSAPICRTD